MKFTYASGDRPLEGYTIKRGIGRGGFGEVYYATSDGGKEVALKLVQRHLDVELRGVSHCLNLKHQNLITLYDVRQADNGDHWVVMEYMAGDRLEDVIARHPKGLAADEVLRWMDGICLAVQYLHSNAIVHRDLKPGNVFWENGTVKLGDYGLSKFITASRRSGQTESVGTVYYMAPEVANGCYGKEIDIYALGVMLFELLTGEVPFRGESVGEILMKHLTADPDLSRLPERFRPIVGRAMHKDPAKRHQGVADLIAELHGEVAPRPVPAHRPAFVQPVQARGTGDAPPPGRAVEDAFQRLERALMGLKDRARSVGSDLPSPGRVVAHLVRIVLALASLAVALALLPLRLLGGALFVHSAEGVKQAAARVSDSVRRDPMDPVIAFLKFLVSAILSVGGGLLSVAFLLLMDADDEPAIAIGLGTGAFIFGSLVRAYFLSKTQPRRWTAFVVAFFSSCVLGFAVGALTIGTTFLLMGSGWPQYQVAMPFGIGSGLITCGIMLVTLLRSAIWAPATPSYGVFAVGWRSLLCVILAAGVGLATGGLGAAVFDREEVAVALGLGMAFMTGGGLIRTVLASLRAQITPGIMAFFGFISCLMIGAGIGTLTAATALMMFGGRHEELMVVAGVGSGLLACGLIGGSYFRNRGLLMGARFVLTRFLLSAAFGAGAGLLSGGFMSMLIGHSDEVAVMLGVGAGFICFAVAASMLLLRPVSAQRSA